MLGENDISMKEKLFFNYRHKHIKKVICHFAYLILNLVSLRVFISDSILL